MANNFWYYPDATSPTNTLEFNLKGGHLYEAADVSLVSNMDTDLSKGGTRYFEIYGDDKEQYDFAAIIYESHASIIDYADVKAFLAVVNGEYFTWRDEDVVDRVVCIINNQKRFQKIPPIYRKFSVTLEVQ